MPLTTLPDSSGVTRDLYVIGVAFLLLFFLFAIVFAVAWWVQRQRDSLSPYTGSPLRSGEQLSFYAKEQILRYVYERSSYDNRIFSLYRAALCRETGRIFPNALTWYGTLYVDWNFIQKKRPGCYVSWGSLSFEQQQNLYRLYGSLHGFQTAFSSSRPSPREVEPEYVFAKPGPLYVDINDDTLMGWKCVPGTDFEVLIVQHPPILVLPESLSPQQE